MYLPQMEASSSLSGRTTHTVVVSDVAFEVDVRYIDLAAVGGGSYGACAFLLPLLPVISP